MRTLFLLPDTWDLELDINGNIASATSVYQQSQDVASAGRTFTKDLYFDQTAGIPYFQDILGTRGFPLSLYKMYLENAATSVSGVVSAQASLTADQNRNVGGAILFTNENGQSGGISL